MYWWGLSQNLFVNNFKWVDDISEFIEDITKSYESDKAHFLVVYVHHSKKVHKWIIKLKKKRQKKLKASIKLWLVYKKVNRVIKFNPKA